MLYCVTYRVLSRRPTLLAGRSSDELIRRRRTVVFDVAENDLTASLCRPTAVGRRRVLRLRSPSTKSVFVYKRRERSGTLLATLLSATMLSRPHSCHAMHNGID